MILIVQKESLSKNEMMNIIIAIGHHLETFGLSKEEVEGDFYKEFEEQFKNYNIKDAGDVNSNKYSDYELVYFVGFNPISKYPITDLENGIGVTVEDNKTCFRDLISEEALELIKTDKLLEKDDIKQIIIKQLDVLRKEAENKRQYTELITRINNL